MRPVTWVVIEEVRSGEWGIGRARDDNERCSGAGRRPETGHVDGPELVSYIS